jgi:hypothetical protein
VTLAVRMSQPRQAPLAGDERRTPVLLWSAEGPVAMLGDCRDAQGFPVPVAPSPRTLFGPRGCCLVAENGPLWIADTGHHRLLGWRHCPCADDVPADWVIGQPDFCSEGRNAKTEPGPTTLNVPTGITVCGDGLAVADAWNHRVLIWRQLPQNSHCPPDLVLGQPDFENVAINRGRSTSRADTLYWPSGVSAWGEALVVADTGNRRVLIWVKPPERNGQPADLVLGQTGFDGRDENAGGEPTGMSMRWPHAITRWGGALCVADAGNNRIMIWGRMPLESGAECQWILGQTDTAHVDHNGGHYWPQAGTLNMPYGMAALGDWLVVADTANSRLFGWHKQDLATAAKARALAAQPNFERKGDNQWAFPSRDTLCWPYGLSICEGLLAVADSGNNRVMIRPLHREVLG